MPESRQKNPSLRYNLYAMEKKRCAWVTPGNTLYEKYHDTEWGVPVHDDQTHFEFLVLEGAQAGLNWLLILSKRNGYRRAFSNFDPKKVARYDEKKIATLINDKNIIRNELKIRSCVNNAIHFLEIQKEFGSFDSYVWRFVNDKPIQNNWKTVQEVPCESIESRTLSADLIKRGFKFVGPKIIYSYMQATGLINDHTTDCFCYRKKL